MGWFTLDDTPNTRWRGIQLRLRCLHRDAWRAIRQSQHYRDTDETWMVRIDQIVGKVTLEVWQRVKGTGPGDPCNRVFYVAVAAQEPKEWICEGDMGRGLTRNWPRNA